MRLAAIALLLSVACASTTADTEAPDSSTFDPVVGQAAAWPEPTHVAEPELRTDTRPLPHDIAQFRRQYPRTRYIGAFDKMVMNQGEAALRGEFERLLPVMRQGGFIASCDHQTPPGVSLEEYKTYVRLLREYAQKAVV